MRLNFDMTLLERMTEGVVLLNRQAQVMAHNQVAEPWLPPVTAMAAGLKRLIDAEVQGRVQLPSRIDLFGPAARVRSQPADAWLCKNGRTEYAIFIVADMGRPHDSPTRPPEVSEKPFVALLGAAVLDQLVALRGLLQLGDLVPRAEPAVLRAQCLRVERLLRDISELATLKQRDQLFADERLQVSEILRTLLPTLVTRRGDYTVTYAFEPDQREQGVIYGHAQWLTYALRAMLEALADSAVSHSRIPIGVRQMGDFVVITGHLVDSRSSRAMPAAAGMAAATPPPSEVVGEVSDAAIRRQLCQRIIELHGGQLKLAMVDPNSSADDPGNPLDSFSLTLATGLPDGERSRASCGSCRYVLQAQAYAVDMAQILSHH